MPPQTHPWLPAGVGQTGPQLSGSAQDPCLQPWPWSPPAGHLLSCQVDGTSSPGLRRVRERPWLTPSTSCLGDRSSGRMPGQRGCQPESCSPPCPEPSCPSRPSPETSPSMGVRPSHPPQHTHTHSLQHVGWESALRTIRSCKARGSGEWRGVSREGLQAGPPGPTPNQQPTSPPPSLKGCPSFQGACLYRRPPTTKGNRGSNGHSIPP